GQRRQVGAEKPLELVARLPKQCDQDRRGFAKAELLELPLAPFALDPRAGNQENGAVRHVDGCADLVFEPNAGRQPLVVEPGREIGPAQGAGKSRRQSGVAVRAGVADEHLHGRRVAQSITSAAWGTELAAPAKFLAADMIPRCARLHSLSR